jgi:glycerol uptake facilitator-like aquaporin
VNLSRRAAAEGLGTAFLLAVVVGSGIMGERLSGGNEAIALLANSLATGCGLIALILTLGPISGAHINPAVSLVMAVRGDLRWRELPAYVAAQMGGAIAGVMAAHAMFDVPLLELSSKARPGLNLIWSEVIATFGLLSVILVCSRRRPEALPYVVGAFITAAYWFTASTSFANPAVTVARAFSDTFTGIGIADVPGFLAGEGIAVLLIIAALRQLRVSMSNV